MLSKRSQRKRHKRHGFLSRMKTKKGSQVITRRRRKGRHRLGQGSRKRS